MKKLSYLSAALIALALSGSAVARAESIQDSPTTAVSRTAERADGSEKNPWDGIFAKNKAALKRAFANRKEGYVTFRVNKDGKVTPESADEYTLAKYLCDMEIILSEEGFGLYGSRFASRGEYVAAMLEGSDCAMYFNGEGELLNAPEPELHIRVYCRNRSEEDSDEKIFLSSASWLLGMLNGQELNAELTAALESGKDYFCDSRCYCSEESVLSVSAAFFHDSDYPVSFEETLTAEGKSGVFIGGTFVPSDTEKLFVTSRDKSTALFLAGDSVPEDCEILSCGNDAYMNTVYDFEEIAEKLPNLKELHMFQAQGENQSAIARLTKLEALSYYVTADPYSPTETTNDYPFVNLPKLKSLRLYGDYDDYSFLNDMKGLKSLHVETSAIDGNMKSLFECPAVTSLNLTGWTEECKNIYRLRNLKALELSGSEIDFTAVGKLVNLRKLGVRCFNDNINIEELANLDKLTELSLSTVKSDDWSFLKGMDSLSSLTLTNLKNVRNEDIAGIGNLTSLWLISTPISDFKGSKTLEEYGESFGSCINYSALAKCPKLKSINIFGSDTALDCKYLTKLPVENIYCDGTKVVNPLKLVNIKSLKNITFAIIDDDFAYEQVLREALPDCEIYLSNDAFFRNYY